MTAVGLMKRFTQQGIEAKKLFGTVAAQLQLHFVTMLCENIKEQF
jgi:hypothetical protein